MRSVRRVLSVLFFAGLMMSGCARKMERPLPVYPTARRADTTETLHGVEVSDPYRWMEEIDSAETRAWVEAQSTVAEDYLAALPDRERIRKRLERVWDYERRGLPVRRAGRFFSMRNDGLQNQSVLYWQEGAESEPKVLLDPNTMSEDGTVSLSGWSVSEDGKLLAYALSQSGSDWKEWRVREVDTGVDRDDLVRWSKFSGASWTHNSKGFFYSAYDAPETGEELSEINQNQKLFHHRLGTDQSEDAVIHESPDYPEHGFSGWVTDDGRWLIIGVWKGTHKENNILYKDLAAKGAEVRELIGGFTAEWDFAGNLEREFFFKTDHHAPMGRVVTINLKDPAVVREIVPECEDTLRGAGLVGKRIILTYLSDASSKVRKYTYDGVADGEIPLPGIGSAGGFGGRPGDTDTYFAYSSFNTPGELWHYDFITGKTRLHYRPEVAFDPDDFVTRQVFATSADGTRVPVFLTHRLDLTMTADTPMLLYGYGGFNIALTPWFWTTGLVWMERGGVVAVANLRGGGEFGETWYKNGTVLQKQNVFDDFVAAAEFLIEHNMTSTPHLAIAGRSNGGLLVAACMTQRPDLFGAVSCGVGVLDMLRFDKFTIGWAWKSDYGDPGVEEEFHALLKYSPYHNLKKGAAYPPTLVTTADHDDRVFPAHSFKFGAALQEIQSGDAPVILRIDTKAGHGAGKPTSRQILEAADELAFLSEHVGD